MCGLSWVEFLTDLPETPLEMARRIIRVFLFMHLDPEPIPVLVISLVYLGMCIVQGISK